MKNRKLPKYVSKDRSRYYYRPFLGRENGKIKWGKTIRLCALDAPMSEVWARYEAVIGVSTNTIHWLLSEYNRSDKFKSLSPATQAGYEGYKKVICNRQGNTGTFGEADLSAITKRTIRKYIDSYSSEVSANRHVQYISAAWNWATQRFEQVPEINPCEGVTLNSEKARTRYVTDVEYQIVYEAALSMRVPFFAHAMELAYLCRARRGEVFSLTHDDVKPDGVFLKRSKGSMDELTLWSPRLRAAVSGAKSINSGAPRPLVGATLIHDKFGKPYKKNALDSAWRRIIDKAKKNGLTNEFTYHDIKAKGATDHDKENAAGHKSKKMEAVYDRLPTPTKPTR